MFELNRVFVPVKKDRESFCPRNTILLSLGLLLILAITGCESPLVFEKPRQIIFISLDTLRADMLGYDGYTEYETSPFLDSFAAENVVFEKVIAQEPRTLTSHMSLFTGLLPQHHLVQDEAPLRKGVATLALKLKQHGYRTQAFVDGGYLNRRWGFSRGFEGYDDHSLRKDPSNRKVQGLERIQPLASRWLKQNADQDFFLFLHTYDIHGKGYLPFYHSPEPYRGMFSESMNSDLFVDSFDDFESKWEGREGVPSEADRQFIRATYAEGIRYVDARLQELFSELKQLGIYDNALIIVWSDHGEGLFDHQGWDHDEIFDHTIRVPLIMKIPGLKKGRTVQTLVSSVDIAPTILELAGLPDALAGDGVSLIPYLQKEDPEKLAYSIRTKDGRRLFSIRSQTHHLIEDQDESQEMFFDLQNDPEELEDILGEKRRIWRPLRTMLSRFVEAHDRDTEAHPVEAPVEVDEETQNQLRALGYLK